MDIVHGFLTLFADPVAVLFVFAAAATGVIVGALPGLTSAAAIAMLVPITFYMEPLHALAFLYVIGKRADSVARSLRFSSIRLEPRLRRRPRWMETQ